MPLEPFPTFDVSNETSLGPRWKKYLVRFNNLMVAQDISDSVRKRALLLHYVGEDANDIFDN